MSRFPKWQAYSDVFVPFHPVRGHPHYMTDEVRDYLQWSKCMVNNGVSTQSQQESSDQILNQNANVLDPKQAVGSCVIRFDSYDYNTAIQLARGCATCAFNVFLYPY